MRTITQADHTTTPVRSYKEIVAAMRAKGDKTLTVQQIDYYIKSAFRKLRPLLADLSDAIEPGGAPAYVRPVEPEKEPRD
ncbi:MAG: hypothetical protein LLG00_16735 [Planctomycetaceae bacterium]|nr:hypothetical protein [Planctomycetaceae bacterium]